MLSRLVFLSARGSKKRSKWKWRNKLENVYTEKFQILSDILEFIGFERTPQKIVLPFTLEIKWKNKYGHDKCHAKNKF